MENIARTWEQRRENIATYVDWWKWILKNCSKIPYRHPKSVCGFLAKLWWDKTVSKNLSIKYLQVSCRNQTALGLDVVFENCCFCLYKNIAIQQMAVCVCVKIPEGHGLVPIKDLLDLFALQTYHQRMIKKTFLEGESMCVSVFVNSWILTITTLYVLECWFLMFEDGEHHLLVFRSSRWFFSCN